jgi:hypothetical protein
MDVEQITGPEDPFALDGKNVRRVIPQVRRNIELQRSRMRAYAVGFLICLVLGTLGCRSTGLWRGLGIVLLIMAAFNLFGVFADRRLMKWHQQRLLECERRLNQEGSADTQTSSH